MDRHKPHPRGVVSAVLLLNPVARLSECTPGAAATRNAGVLIADSTAAPLGMETSTMRHIVKHRLWLACAALGLGTSAFAQYSPSGSATPTAGAKSAAAAPVTPPAYTPVRWNEDYSYLKTAPKSDLFDPVKYIPLGPDDWYLSLGGQYRFRYEYFNNVNFSPAGSAQDEDGYYLNRLLVYADLHLGPMFRVFAQGKSSLIDDRDGGPRPVDADEADIQQLFADARFSLGGKDAVTLRFGRQDLLYGAQRLISPLDWTNARRTFEGGRASLTLGATSVDAFWVRPVDIDKERFNDGDGQTSFAGVYATLGLPDVMNGGGTKVDAYFLALNRTNAQFAVNSGGPNRDEDRYTVGVRFASTPKPFDVDVELDYQFGQFGDQDISAYSIAAEAGYTLAGCPMAPRLYLGFDLASGDDGNGGTFGTFNQLFPLGHAYFGYIDVIGRQNIIDVHPGAEMTVVQDAAYAKKVTLRTDYHLFWRENENDGVYNVLAGGGSTPPQAGLLRGAGGSGEMYIGSEIDVLLNWQVDRHLLLFGGYSHFFAGDFIQDTGASRDIDFAYFALVYTF
jgi:hypothetical protein